MVSADMDIPFGESTCVACGTCLQVCPTGAMSDKSEKAKAVLGYEPKTKIKQGIPKTVEWFRANMKNIEASAKF
jgi:predicted molibdopterin-dependent oxidoreductase YjgC